MLPIVLSAVLLVIAGITFFILTQTRSQADSIFTNANVTNAAPVVDSIFVNEVANQRVAQYNDGSVTPIIPTAGGTKTIYVNGVISDANGVGSNYQSGNLKDVRLKFFRAKEGTGHLCSPDRNDCYVSQVSCMITPKDETSVYYSCEIPLHYFADSTVSGGTYPSDKWVARITATDDSDATGMSNVNTVEVASVLALSIPPSINYGTLVRAQSTTSDNNVEMVITQLGNVEADVEISGGDMTCSIFGTIPAANQKWSKTDVGAADLTSSGISGSASATSLGLTRRTDETMALTKSLFFNLVMPAAVSGTCSGTVNITAIPVAM